MRDISSKTTTFRTASASARLSVSPATIRLVKAGNIPKGDPLPVARVAGIQAAKQTSSIIPFCHPIPIDHADCFIELQKSSIVVTATVTAIHKTGVEMEALTAASVAALTLYDMLKPVDDSLSITDIRLLEKRGGKSDRVRDVKNLKTAVVVVSDSTAAGKRTDASGAIIRERLEDLGARNVAFKVVPDDREKLSSHLKELADVKKVDIIFTTGGTGLGPRDLTPEVTGGLIDRALPGVAETIRAHGQDRLPTAMLGRSVAGVRGRTVIVNLPGSPKGVSESLDAILPGLFHAIDILRGGSHD